jgi:uncharacterized membrane protein YkoI
MKGPLLLTLALIALAKDSQAQGIARFSGGEVTRSSTPVTDLSRLSKRIPGVEPDQRGRVLVGGDSAQRIAMNDFEWRGRVSSVEVDEQDARLFWDIKIVPDASPQTIVRYRVDAGTGGILNIREFTGIRGLARNAPRKP